MVQKYQNVSKLVIHQLQDVIFIVYLEVTELEMLRFSLDKDGRSRNEYMWRTSQVGQFGDKVKKKVRLRWF